MFDFERSLLEKIPLVKKYSSLLYDLTFGLARQYQEKTLELAKIKAAEYYLQAMKHVRRHMLAIVSIVFCLLLAAVSMVVFPVAVIALSSLSPQIKMISIGALGAFYLLVSLIVVSSLFSEKRWMKLAGSSEWVESFVKKH
jgi:hypothetical protein